MLCGAAISCAPGRATVSVAKPATARASTSASAAIVLDRPDEPTTRPVDGEPVAVAGDGASNAPAMRPDPMPTTPAEAMNRFGFRLHVAFRAEQHNLIFSPADLEAALAMVAAGARGDTQREMSAVLGLSALPDPRKAMGSLLASVESSGARGESTLRLASRAWVARGFPIMPQLASLVRGAYHSSSSFAVLPSNAGAAASAVNAWVAGTTEGRVRELLPPGLAFDNPIGLMLTDAAYFRGRWLYPFRESETVEEAFHGPLGRRTVHFMSVTREFDYGRGPGYRVLELPYRGHFDLILVLPDENDGLEKIEAQMEKESGTWLSSVSRTRVDVAVPRWRTASDSMKLNELLADLGMPLAFDADKADFSGLSPGLWIGGVYHQALIETNEAGTEAAAAATAVVTFRPVSRRVSPNLEVSLRAPRCPAASSWHAWSSPGRSRCPRRAATSSTVGTWGPPATTTGAPSLATRRTSRVTRRRITASNAPTSPQPPVLSRMM
jgi:serpin B